MHLTVLFKSWGQAATAPFNLFEGHVWAFFQWKRHEHGHVIFCTQVQFLQSLAQEFLRESNSPLPPIFKSAPRRLCALLCPHVFTLSIKVIDRHQTAFLKLARTLQGSLKSTILSRTNWTWIVTSEQLGIWVHAHIHPTRIGNILVGWPYNQWNKNTANVWTS